MSCKFELQNPKCETNPKFEFSNVQNALFRNKVTWIHLIAYFEFLSFDIVSDFEIRISNLFDVRRIDGFTDRQL